jgi:Sec-independent protein secretion pathway component TatC
MSLLAAPMILLYELGIILIARGSKTAVPARI